MYASMYVLKDREKDAIIISHTRTHARTRSCTQAFVSPASASSSGWLVSSSKDALVKVWDLDTQHCCQTLTGHKGEVWALDVDPREKRLVTGEEEVCWRAGWSQVELEVRERARLLARGGRYRATCLVVFGEVGEC